MGICKLCNEEKDLIKRSHIWPDFMYKGMEDDKGRFYVINSDNPYKHKTVQSGAYERGIFCAECDNVRLGKLERYASNNLFRKAYLVEGIEFKQVAIQGGLQVIHCENVDYVQFKLFLLSLLWRASISTEHLFENFKLSEGEEEFLRKSIYDQAVVAEETFPCILLTSTAADLDKNFIAIDPFNPDMVKFYINAFVYTFYLTDVKKDETTKVLSIGMDKKMGIMKISPAQWNKILESVIEGAVEASKKNLK